MNTVETIIVFNIVGFAVMLLIIFVLGWWFLKKQSKMVSTMALKIVQQEVHKAKQQMVKLNRQMLKDFKLDDTPILDFTPVVIDSKSIRAIEEIYKAFVVWGKTSADVALKITKISAQSLAGMNNAKQDEVLKGFYSDARKALNMAQQLSHQIEFDAAYLDKKLIQEMSDMAKKTVTQSEKLLESVKRSAEKSKATSARDSVKLFSEMDTNANALVSFHNLDYKNFVQNALAQRVRELRSGMNEADGEAEPIE